MYLSNYPSLHLYLSKFTPVTNLVYPCNYIVYLSNYPSLHLYLSKSIPVTNLVYPCNYIVYLSYYPSLSLYLSKSIPLTTLVYPYNYIVYLSNYPSLSLYLSKFTPVTTLVYPCNYIVYLSNYPSLSLYLSKFTPVTTLVYPYNQPFLHTAGQLSGGLKINTFKYMTIWSSKEQTLNFKMYANMKRPILYLIHFSRYFDTQCHNRMQLCVPPLPELTVPPFNIGETLVSLLDPLYGFRLSLPL